MSSFFKPRSVLLDLPFRSTLWLLFLLSISLAQAQGTLTNGGSHAGEIAVGGSHSWTFSANAGDGVMVRAGSPTFSPRLRVFDAQNALIEDVASGSSSNRDNYVTFEAASSGTYTVIISAAFSNQSGSYLLHLARAPVSPGDEDLHLINGAQHLDTLPVGGLGLYSFNANEGDGIMARMGARGSTLSPWLRLYGPDGSLITEAAHGSSSNRDNFVTAEAPATGVYTLVVSTAFLGQSGNYGVHLARAPVAVDDADLPLINGFAHAGDLPVGGLHVGSFEADEGTGIMVRMGARDGAALSPWLRLYGPDGALITEAAHGSSSNRDNFVVAEAPAAGIYTVAVSAAHLGQSGAYGLHLALAPGDITVAENDQGGDFINGLTYAGEIWVGDVDVWSFHADEGDGLMVRMGATSGALTPWLRLYGPDGALLAEAASGSSSNRDNYVIAEALASGVHTVAVSAAHFGQTGLYRLNLAQVPGEFILSEDDEGGPMHNAIVNPGALGIGEMDMWTFSGIPGDRAFIGAGTVNLTPWIRVHGPDGTLVGEAASGSSGNRTNSLTLNITDEGLYTVVLTASILGQSGTYNLRLSRVPPDLIVPETQIIDEGDTLSVSISAQNPDEPNKPLMFSLVSAPPGVEFALAGLTSATVTWPTTEADGPSTNTIVVSVTDTVDGTPYSRTNSFTVIVNEINHPPVLTLPPDQSLNELSALSVSASATDPDLPPNPLTFSLIDPPAGMTINPATGAIAWTPTEAQGPSTHVITVRVTDFNEHAVNEQELSDTQTFTVVVNEVNHAPVLSVPENQSVNELATLNVSASAIDSDLPPNPLTFSLIDPPPGMTIDSGTGAIAWTPTEAQGPSTNVITVRVTDLNEPAINEQQLSDTRTFTVIVNEVNHAPVLTVPEDLSIDELTTLDISASATDSDLPENPLTFSLESGPEGMTIDPDTGAIAWTPTEAQGPSTNVVTVTVTDLNEQAINEQQLSDTRSFTVIVNEVNHAPVLTIPENQTINELTTLNVSASATDSDLPENPLTFSLESAPEGMTIDPATGAIAWTPTEAQGPSTNVITIRVTDLNEHAINDQQLSDTQTWTVIVNEVNHAPVLDPIEDRSQHYSQPVAIQVVATDIDIPVNPLTFSLEEAPPGMTIDSVTGLISWSPAANQIGTYTVTVRVTDHNPFAVNEQELSDTTTFQFTIGGEGSSLAVTRLPGNLIQLTITGDLGLYQLLTSTNLIDWDLLDEIRVTDSPRLYVDPEPAGAPARYYILRFIPE
jgi:uncharacterized protein (DUF1778 family)